jgi:glyoxylase-like metal-dependent hydrolase (beta-lactamase superfamily II)
MTTFSSLPDRAEADPASQNAIVSRAATTAATTKASIARTVGRFTVTALDDGRYPVDWTELVGIDRTEAMQLTCACGHDTNALSVNAFLISGDDSLVLVDAGAGEAAAPGMGNVMHQLTEIGVDASDIRHVLLTHLHGDHAGGLVDSKGAGLFPNAEILLHAREAEFWLDGKISSDVSDRMKRTYANARRALDPYRDRQRRIEDGQILPGISAVALPGHTPGHTGWLIESQNQRLLLWGDTIHFCAVQMAHPDVPVIFDVNAQMATLTRRRLLELAADEGIEVAGAHLPYPGFGFVVREAGHYRYEPAHRLAAAAQPDKN